MNTLQQLGLAAFGLVAIWLALGNSKRKRWAPFVGLAGQPFWLWYAVEARALGILIVCCAYTVVYLHAVAKQLSPKTPGAHYRRGLAPRIEQPDTWPPAHSRPRINRDKE